MRRRKTIFISLVDRDMYYTSLFSINCTSSYLIDHAYCFKPFGSNVWRCSTLSRRLTIGRDELCAWKIGMRFSCWFSK